MNPEAALKRVVAGCRKAFAAVFVFSLAINLMMLIVPIYMMQMYDRVIASRNVDTLLLLTIIAIAGLLAMSLVEMMRSRIMVRLGEWVDRSLSGPVLSGGMNDSLRAGGLNGAGGLRELNTLRGFLTGAGIFPLLDAPWVPIFVAIIFMVHPVLGYIAVGGAVIIFLFALANDLWTRAPLKQANGAAAKALYRADAMVRNADVAAAMGMEPHLVRRWRASNEEGLQLQALASDRAGGISSMAKFVRLALQIAMLGTGAYLVTQGEITGGAMIAGSIILSRAMAPIEQSINAWRGLVAARGAFDNIKKLLQRTPATGDAMNLPKPAGAISIEGVGFMPPGAVEPVLRGVSLEIKPGECVGLIGASASGKTTLARVMVGSWRPTAGHARLDGADVFVWEAADRGRYIGYLPQDVELFDGPVRENIARMGEVDGDAVIAAAQMAGVHDLILRLPNGYETVIGDGGARLSGGQRQRVALARALYGDPSLVVLDEPNSNLDTDGERALMEALRTLKERGVTTIVVAHRPSVLASVDRLVVMHQGRIEMEGPRDEVLAKVAPGSLDAVRRAALADGSIEGEAVADGSAPTSPDGQPKDTAAAPSGPMPSSPAPSASGEPPVVRIRPGAASRPRASRPPEPAQQPASAATAAAAAVAAPATSGSTATAEAAAKAVEVEGPTTSAAVDAPAAELAKEPAAMQPQEVEVAPAPEPQPQPDPKPIPAAAETKPVMEASDAPAADAARARSTAERLADALRRRAAEPAADGTPKPDAAAGPSDGQPKEDIKALFDRITAAAPQPFVPKPKPVPKAPGPVADVPPEADSRSEPTGDAPPRLSPAPTRAPKVRERRVLRPSPTPPGGFFAGPARPMTGDARPSEKSPEKTSPAGDGGEA